jgi:hypothetical protein
VVVVKTGCVDSKKKSSCGLAWECLAILLMRYLIMVWVPRVNELWPK